MAFVSSKASEGSVMKVSPVQVQEKVKQISFLKDFAILLEALPQLNGLKLTKSALDIIR